MVWALDMATAGGAVDLASASIVVELPSVLASRGRALHEGVLIQDEKRGFADPLGSRAQMDAR